MTTPDLDFGWFGAVREATVKGDVERARVLGILAGAMLDLADDLSDAEWDKLYAKVSARVGVKPALRLMSDRSTAPAP